jgi:hypothetical protein
VGLPALESSTGKFTSNGSLLSQNGIKYSSEPELQKKEPRSGSATGYPPDTDGYRNFREGGKFREVEGCAGLISTTIKPQNSQQYFKEIQPRKPPKAYLCYLQSSNNRTASILEANPLSTCHVNWGGFVFIHYYTTACPKRYL